MYCSGCNDPDFRKTGLSLALLALFALFSSSPNIAAAPIPGGKPADTEKPVDDDVQFIPMGPGELPDDLEPMEMTPADTKDISWEDTDDSVGAADSLMPGSIIEKLPEKKPLGLETKEDWQEFGKNVLENAPPEIRNASDLEKAQYVAGKTSEQMYHEGISPNKSLGGRISNLGTKGTCSHCSDIMEGALSGAGIAGKDNSYKIETAGRGIQKDVTDPMNVNHGAFAVKVTGKDGTEQVVVFDNWSEAAELEAAFEELVDGKNTFLGFENSEYNGIPVEKWAEKMKQGHGYSGFGVNGEVADNPDVEKALEKEDKVRKMLEEAEGGVDDLAAKLNEYKKNNPELYKKKLAKLKAHQPEKYEKVMEKLATMPPPQKDEEGDKTAEKEGEEESKEDEKDVPKKTKEKTVVGEKPETGKKNEKPPVITKKTPVKPPPPKQKPPVDPTLITDENGNLKPGYTIDKHGTAWSTKKSYILIKDKNGNWHDESLGPGSGGGGKQTPPATGSGKNGTTGSTSNTGTSTVKQSTPKNIPAPGNGDVEGGKSSGSSSGTANADLNLVTPNSGGSVVSDSGSTVIDFKTGEVTESGSKSGSSGSGGGMSDSGVTSLNFKSGKIAQTGSDSGNTATDADETATSDGTTGNSGAQAGGTGGTEGSKSTSATAGQNIARQRGGQVARDTARSTARKTSKSVAKETSKNAGRSAARQSTRHRPRCRHR